MITYALLTNNVVVDVLELDDECVIAKIKEGYQAIDITDETLVPCAGWILVGNRLTPPEVPTSGDSLDAQQQTQQRLFGEKLVNKATDWFGARNLKLAREGTPVDVAALSTALLNAKLLLQGGALKTARYICSLSKPAFPAHTDIFDLIIEEINLFLAANGW